MENQVILNQLFDQLKYPTGIKPLKLKPSTKFIKFGILSMFDDSSKSKCKSVYVFLFNEMIILTKILPASTKTKLVSETISSIVSSKKSLTVEYMIPTSKYTVLDCITIDNCPTFTLVQEDQNPIRFYCLENEEKNSWISELEAQQIAFYDQHLFLLKATHKIQKELTIENTKNQPFLSNDPTKIGTVSK
jgi:hypothetical protein